MSARRMPRARLLPLAATALAVTTLQAGQQSTDPVAPPVFRASTDLLTTDVVVTDKEGRHVTDLTIDDFEVTHSGRKVALQQAVYVSTIRSPETAAGQPRPADASGSRRPPASGAPSAALTEALASQAPPPARTIAFVVDDLGLSWESTVHVRKALRRYVESEMAPGDLVAVVRTAGGIGALQQFTTDRRLVQMAVDRVQWTLASATAASGLEFSETGDPAADVLGEPTLRIFRPGSDVVYAYEVYDGLDEKKARALRVQTSLLRNGKVVYESPPKPVDAGRKSSRVRVIPIAGLLSLGDDMPEGMYTLEVAVGPEKDRKRGAKQWVDLEVRGR